MIGLQAILVAQVVSFAIQAAAPDTGVVHHPQPKRPIYVEEAWYDSLKKQIPRPPAKLSPKQKSDEKELYRLQTGRTAQECEAAKTEVLVSLQVFYGTPESPIPPDDIETLSPFFEQLRNDADYFIQKLKVDFPRKRPFLYLQGLEPCVPKEVTGSYPSGHAVLSQLFAMVLLELYPEHGRYIEQRATTIANHRVVVGMHHPSDIEAGQTLAKSIYGQLRKSDQYKKDFASNKESIQRK